MKRITVLLFMALGVTPSLKSQQNIDSLINAEKSFAKSSVYDGIKKSFLANLDTNSVVFNKGQIYNGYKKYDSLQEGPGILNWAPAFACLSSTGDMGFTTGPFEFYETSLQDTPVARGQYTTIWKLNGAKQWKAVVDFGIQYLASPGEISTIKKLTLSPTAIPQEDTTTVIQQVETEFIKAYNKTGRLAFDDNITLNSWFNRNGYLPYDDSTSVKEAIKTIPEGLLFTPAGWAISKAGDLGYVYGKVIINKQPENYLRIWFRQGGGWKIILQVLSW